MPRAVYPDRVVIVSVLAAFIMATRALGNEYTNSTGRPLFVFGEISLTTDGANSHYAYIDCYVKVGLADKLVGRIGIKHDAADHALTLKVPFFFIVPATNKYRIEQNLSAGSTATLESWNEVTI